ncbi:MAG: alcohol dehydrogenase catalytic domain-containing protein [Candidatus Thorarchaeota archaeon]|nr:alcohol dehydrogenase catalytic domain-containing protein [Candidatus Thorarchaeota archaeon]
MAHKSYYLVQFNINTIEGFIHLGTSQILPMQSLVLTADGLQIADTPIPPLLPGDVRIEVRSVGICGTDLAIWRGDYEVDLPLVLGHEIAGSIHESSVPGIEVGTLVTTEIDLSCGRCWYCRSGDRQYCEKKKILGITCDGGLSEYLSVPADIIHPLPLSVTTVQATFVEPLASAIQTQKRAPAKENEVVVIFGSGKLALLLAQIYDASGANVHIVGRNRQQLGLARQLGLRNTYDSIESNWKSKILNVTNGIGPRIAIEATGNIDGFSLALQTVRNGGIVALKSMHGCQFSLNPTDIVNRELTLFGISRGPFKEAIDMLDKGRIEVTRLLSKEFKLEEGTKAFEFASQPSVTKVVINI